MARAQNSAKGRLQKQTWQIIASGEIWADDYSTSAKVMSFDANGLVLAGGVKVSNKQLITGNSTGIKFGNADSALPGAVDNGVQLVVISNSTGVAFGVNTTGTTHKYLQTTSKQPT